MGKSQEKAEIFFWIVKKLAPLSDFEFGFDFVKKFLNYYITQNPSISDSKHKSVNLARYIYTIYYLSLHFLHASIRIFDGY
jgi:hypothetical protein